MRKLWLMGCLALVLAPLALAQDKVDASWNCGKATDDHNIAVGDKANHSYGVNQSTCTASKGEVGGVKEKTGVGTQFNEVMGSAITWHGVFVETLEGGDKITYHYMSPAKGMTKDGQFVSGSNKWTMVGGTGKFAGIKGEGSCAGKGDGAGGATWDCTGTYTLKK